MDQNSSQIRNHCQLQDYYVLELELYKKMLEDWFKNGDVKTDNGSIDVSGKTTMYMIRSWSNKFCELVFREGNYYDKQQVYIYIGQCKLCPNDKLKRMQMYRENNYDVYQLHVDRNSNMFLEILNPRSKTEPFLVTLPCDIKYVINEFVSDCCNLEIGNKKLRSFAVNLWSIFDEWQNENKITPKLKHKQFYEAISDRVDYDYTKRVRIQNKNSIGWYGICVKESNSTAA